MLPNFELSCAAFEQHGLILTKNIYQKLDKYAELLVKYNNIINLTAITKPDDILIKHFIDSILIYKYVNIPENSYVIDVGTGAGFPSVPMKIYRPDIKLTLLDSLNKRIDFLKQLCKMLDISCSFVHGRAEDISKMEDYREKFDFACARAVANLSLLSEYCLPFVKIGGRFAAMKGPNEDISLGYNAVKILGGEIVSDHNYLLLNEERRIIEIKKISQTPPKYPRNSSRIKKNPL